MMYRIVSAVLATLVMSSVSAQAQQPQQIRPAGKPAAWMAANGWDGTKVSQPDGRVRTDWFCGGNVQPDGSCKRGTISGPRNGSPVASSRPAPVMTGGTTPGAVVLNQGDLDELRRQYELDKAAQRPTPAPQVAAQAPAVQAPAQPFRVFTANVNIGVLAGAFKEDAQSDVLNASVSDVVAQIKKLSGVSVTAERIFLGDLVDCQDVGVKGKQRIGIKQGTKQFVSASTSFEKCQPGQKLYVVKDDNGKYVAIADNSGYLLGVSASAIKIDR